MPPSAYPEEAPRSLSAGEEKEEFLRKGRLVRWIALAFMILFAVLLGFLVNSGASSFPGWSVIVWMEFVVWTIGLLINLFLVLSVVPNFLRRMSDDAGPSQLFLHHLHQQSLIAILLGGVVPGFLFFLIWRQVANAKPSEAIAGSDGASVPGTPMGPPAGTWPPSPAPYPNPQASPSPVPQGTGVPVGAPSPTAPPGYPPPQNSPLPSPLQNAPSAQVPPPSQYAPPPVSPPPPVFTSPVVQSPQPPPSLPTSGSPAPGGFAPPRRICPSCGNPVEAQQRVCLACGRSLV